MEQRRFQKRCPNPGCPIEVLPEAANVCCTCATPAQMTGARDVSMGVRHLSTLDIDAEQSRQVFVPDAEDCSSKEDKDRYEDWRDETLIPALESKGLSAITPQLFPSTGTKEQHFMTLFHGCGVTVFPMCSAVCGHFHKHLLKQICADPRTLRKVLFVVPPPEVVSGFVGWEFTETYQKYDCDRKRKLLTTAKTIASACELGHDVIRRVRTEQQFLDTSRGSTMSRSTISDRDSCPEADRFQRPNTDSRLSFFLPPEPDRVSFVSSASSRKRLTHTSRLNPVPESLNTSHQNESGQHTHPQLHRSSSLESSRTDRTDKTDVSFIQAAEDNVFIDGDIPPQNDTTESLLSEETQEPPTPSHHTGENLFRHPSQSKAHTLHTGSMSPHAGPTPLLIPAPSHHTGSMSSHLGPSPLRVQDHPAPRDIEPLIGQENNAIVESEAAYTESEPSSPYDDNLMSFPFDQRNGGDGFEKSDSALRPGVHVYYNFNECYEPPPSIYVMGNKERVGLTTLLHELYKGDPGTIKPFLQAAEYDPKLINHVIYSLAQKRSSKSTKAQIERIVALSNITRFIEKEDLVLFTLKCLDVSLSQVTSSDQRDGSGMAEDLKKLLESLKLLRGHASDDGRCVSSRCVRRVLILVLAHYPDMLKSHDVIENITCFAEHCANIVEKPKHTTETLDREARILSDVCKAIRKQDKNPLSKTVILIKELVHLFRGCTLPSQPHLERMHETVDGLCRKCKREQKGFMLIVALDTLCNFVYGVHSNVKEDIRQSAQREIDRICETIQNSFPKYTYKLSDVPLLFAHVSKLEEIKSLPHPVMDNTQEDILKDITPNCLKLRGNVIACFRTKPVLEGTYGFTRPKPVLIMLNKQNDSQCEVEILKMLQPDSEQHKNIPKLIAYQNGCTGLHCHLLSFESDPVNLSEKVRTMLHAEEPDHRHLNRRLYYCRHMVDAVQYCHRQHILVRKITAASFCVVKTPVEGSIVKLFDFEGAKLVQNKDTFSWTGSAKDELPTLWMAVTSLLEYRYDVSTDCHSLVLALYEVLSFSLRPYAELGHVPLNILLPQILRNDILPERRPSIPFELYKFLMETILTPSYSIEALKKGLSSRDSCENAWIDGPRQLEYMRAMARQQAEHLQKGIPPELHDVQTLEDLRKERPGTRLLLTEQEHKNKLAFSGKKRNHTKVLEQELMTCHDRCRLSQGSIGEMRGCITKASSTDQETTLLRKLLGSQSPENKHVARITGILRDDNDCRKHQSCIMYLGHGTVPLLQYMSVHKQAASTRYEWYVQAARGMAFLHASRILHCSLTADSLYITDDHVVKIGNLNRASQVTPSVHNKATCEDLVIPFTHVPTDIIRWAPRETLLLGVMSCYSDAAMFGVTLWEVERLVSIGANLDVSLQERVPYGDYNLAQVHDRKIRQDPLLQPEHCTPDLYKLITQLTGNPHYHRPLFPQVIAKLEALQNKGKQPVPLSMNDRDNTKLQSAQNLEVAEIYENTNMTAASHQGQPQRTSSLPDVTVYDCKPKTAVKPKKTEKLTSRIKESIRRSTIVRGFRTHVLRKAPRENKDVETYDIYLEPQERDFYIKGRSPDEAVYEDINYMNIISGAVTGKDQKGTNEVTPPAGGQYLTPTCHSGPRKNQSCDDLSATTPTREPVKPMRSGSDSSLVSPKRSAKLRGIHTGSENALPKTADFDEFRKVLMSMLNKTANARSDKIKEDNGNADGANTASDEESYANYSKNSEERNTKPSSQIDYKITSQTEIAKSTEERGPVSTLEQKPNGASSVRDTQDEKSLITDEYLPMGLNTDMRPVENNIYLCEDSYSQVNGKEKITRKISDGETSVYNLPPAPQPPTVSPKHNSTGASDQPTDQTEDPFNTVSKDVLSNRPVDHSKETYSYADPQVLCLRAPEPTLAVVRPQQQLPLTEIKEGIVMSQKPFKLATADTYETAYETAAHIAFTHGVNTFTERAKPPKHCAGDDDKDEDIDDYLDPGFDSDEFDDIQFGGKSKLS